MRTCKRNPFGGCGADAMARGTLDHIPAYLGAPLALERPHTDIDRLLNGLFRGFMTPWDALPPVTGRGGAGGFLPRMDLRATEKAYEVSLEMPGVTEEDVSLEVRDNTLIISGEKKQENTGEDAGYYRTERAYGSFRRSLALPEDAEIAGIAATRKDGVLRVAIPRKAPETPTSRKIEISKE